MKNLVLNKNLFSFNCIKVANEAYKDIANIVISEKNEYFIVKFLFCKYDEEKTIREYENYLIGLENMQI